MTYPQAPGHLEHKFELWCGPHSLFSSARKLHLSEEFRSAGGSCSGLRIAYTDGSRSRQADEGHAYWSTRDLAVSKDVGLYYVGERIWTCYLVVESRVDRPGGIAIL